MVPLDRRSEDAESQAWRDLRVPGEKSTEAGAHQGAGQEVAERPPWRRILETKATEGQRLLLCPCPRA